MKQVHDIGWLFRDLKPENILLDSEGHVRLADFGMAKRIEEVHKEDEGFICGSYPYIPPEMLAEEGVSTSADVYQIGVVLYEMLKGTVTNIDSFYKEIKKVGEKEKDKVGKLKLPWRLTENARKILNKMLSRDPKKRPTLSELMKDQFFSSIDWKKLANK